MLNIVNYNDDICFVEFLDHMIDYLKNNNKSIYDFYNLDFDHRIESIEGIRYEQGYRLTDDENDEDDREDEFVIDLDGCMTKLVHFCRSKSYDPVKIIPMLDLDTKKQLVNVLRAMEDCVNENDYKPCNFSLDEMNDMNEITDTDTDK